MASTRSLFLLGLLVASFCVTANAGRALTETNKLNLGIGELLEALLGSDGIIKELDLTLDLKGCHHPVELTVLDVVGGAVTHDLVEGVVTKLKVLKVYVTVDGVLKLRVVVEGKKVDLSLKLKDLGVVVDLVEGILGLVLRVVEIVLDGKHVVQIWNVENLLVSIDVRL